MLRLRWLAAALFAVPSLAQTPASTAPKYEDLNALLWVQKSVEYAGVVTETYRTAERTLARAIENKHWTAALEQTGKFEELPPAVILDLDETVLDNSPFMVRLVLSGQPYTEPAWEQWVNEARATALPGAVRFLNSAFLAGVAPVYITNRVCHPGDPADPTLKMLRLLRIPVSAERLLCRDKPDEPTDKSARRALVARSFRILMLFGDDLTDFVSVPRQESTVEARARLLPIYEHLLGERWFVIPNPTYGSWERAIGADVDTKLKALRR
jgi:5'-nucleotidase (lipoprotein e(P4) family)